MAEPVRLLALDLDETFWRGTLTEGGVAFVERHNEIVRELARRGIVCTIVSKNDFDRVKAVLLEHDVWDLFVAPSIDWTPKGARLKHLIESLGLRASSVMFIDDNPLNLEEARRFCPGLQTRAPDYLDNLLADPLFAGARDEALTRLRHYKQLERRRSDEERAGADLRTFLVESRIEVEIEPDVETHLDRFIELINRTNQLNFTKQRLSEDIDTARAQARAYLSGYQWQAGLVRVRDRYGDHGFCGAYVHNSEGRRLHHFAFSCRILGLGVERWLYRKLGAPPIEVKGETLSDLFDPAPVDWIELASSAPTAESPAARRRFRRITARGSCDIGAIVHYLHYDCDDAQGEYHIFRDGLVIRLDHSVFLFHAANGLGDAQGRAAKRIGYIESDFRTRLYDPDDGEAQLAVLGFAADLVQPLIRHRQSGLIAPFVAPLGDIGRRDFTGVDDAELPQDFTPEARRALEIVRAEWDWIGLTRPQDFDRLLRYGLGKIPATARVCLLGLLSRAYRQKDGVERVANPEFEAFNAVMRAAAADFPNVRFVALNDLLADNEIDDRLHFQRNGLFKIYRRICDLV